MARELAVTEKYGLDLSDSATGEICVADKVVDITEDCPKINEDQLVLLYLRSKSGRVVKMVRLSGNKCMRHGMQIHFPMDELDREMDATGDDDTFGQWANWLGLDKSALRSLIEMHAPVV